MYDWIGHNREVFLVNYTDIGAGYQAAHELQSRHGHFATNCMVRLLIHTVKLQMICLWISLKNFININVTEILFIISPNI